METAIEVKDVLKFDFTNRAYVRNGVYVQCGHRTCVNLYYKSVPWMTAAKLAKICCFGTRHSGKQPNLTAEVH